MATLAFAYLAGLLTVLAPCVLPLLPVVLVAAGEAHRQGVLALGAGLALSYTVVGLFIATIGFSIGLDDGFFRAVGGAILLMLGLAIMLPAGGMRLAAVTAPLQSWGDARIGAFVGRGLAGQFAIGALLGAIWSPCVGPTLGAASVLAARGENLASVALTMLVFGIGAATPLVILGSLSRQLMLKWRSKLGSTGNMGKLLLGGLFVAFAILILTRLDKQLETALIRMSPDWLINLTTRF